jgi:hypothetical protein
MIFIENSAIFAPLMHTATLTSGYNVSDILLENFVCVCVCVCVCARARVCGCEGEALESLFSADSVRYS